MFDFGADWASSRLVRYPQPVAAATTRRDDHARDRRQASAEGDRRPDRRAYRWRAAVHRGVAVNIEKIQVMR